MDDVESIRDRILYKISENKMYIDKKQTKYYRLDFVERIANRLGSLYFDCQECADFICSLESHIDNIGTNANKPTYREYHKYLNKVVSHLTSSHSLVDNNYYMSVFMPIGMMLGMALESLSSYNGWSNMGVSTSLWLCIGVALGVSQDAKAKKEGRVI